MLGSLTAGLGVLQAHHRNISAVLVPWLGSL